MKLLLSKSPKTKKNISSFALFFLLIIMFAFTSCKKDVVEPDPVFRGPETTMGNGKANTFFKTDKNNTPLEIGFEMTMDALTGLTQDPTNFAASTFVLQLDQKAKDLTPFEHLVINWQVHGHPPTNVYTVPHFDFHIYTITSAERLAIPPYTPASAPQFDLLPPAGFMPASYIPDMGGIPAMGKHWSQGPPANFSHVLIYGSYNGQVTFVEPMLTLAYLQAGTSTSTAYAQPQNFSKPGKWYPTKYNIYMDNQTHKHYVTLSDFVKR